VHPASLVGAVRGADALTSAPRMNANLSAACGLRINMDMPRKPRDTEPGTVYHLISRFVDREWFITDDEERSCYLHLLGNALVETDWRSLGYAVMSNHFHHALVAGTDALDEWVRRVHSPFADWLNRRHDRIGTIFVRGPKQLAVDHHGVGQLLAYIHNNPVRAGVVSDASLSDWTSHRAYVGLDPVPGWLCVDEGLALAGFTSRTMFDAYVQLHPKDPARDRLRDRQLVEEPDKRESFHRPPKPTVDAAQVVEATTELLGIEPAALRSRRRSRSHVFARHVAVVAADRAGISGVQIANALGLSQQGASFIVNRPSDHAANVAVDRVLARLVDER
jgi:putative transposase